MITIKDNSINRQKFIFLNTLYCYSIVLFFIFILNFAFSIFHNYATASITVSISDTVKKVMPAVVNISTTQKEKTIIKNDFGELDEIFRELFENRRFSIPERIRKLTSLGSGFVIRKDGYIVTNYHVIDEAEEINVTFGDGNINNYEQEDASKIIYKAKLIGKDAQTDLALLKIEAKTDLPYLEFGDSDSASVGDLVIAVGNPFGLGSTVTSGIISAKSRYIAGAGSLASGDFIQTDASMNRGNSGGALIGINGKVLGVNSIIMSPSGGSVGLGFAISSNVAKNIIEQLLTKGKVERSWLGVVVQDFDKQLAEDIGLTKTKGALVSEVVKDSPADKAGIKSGDLIIKFNDKDIENKNKLPKIVSEAAPNTKHSVEILRDDKVKKLTVLLEKHDIENINDNKILNSEKSLSKKNEKSFLGMKIQNLSDIDENTKKKYNIKDDITQGVFVVFVDINSIAGISDIKKGDVIKSINNKEVNNTIEFAEQIKNLKKIGKKSFTFLVVRGGNAIFMRVEYNDNNTLDD